MSFAAFCLGTRLLYWDSILIALSVLACLLMLYAAYAANGGRPAVLLLFAPLALALSFGVSRVMYWYCHMEQFSGLASAFVRRSVGGYCLSGVVIGFVLAALLLRLVRLEPDTALLLDSCAPALALGLFVLRLSSLFNLSCRGKAFVTDPRFQRLPFAYAGSGTEYRFAAFFAEALLFLLAFLLLLWLHKRFYGARPKGSRKKLMPVVGGDLFLFFLLFYSAAELVIDSTRYDAAYFHFNAFISVAQILSAAAILGVLICFSIRSVRRRGVRAHHVLCWLLWMLGLAGAGICEYLVQRHGDRQLACYSAMLLFSLLMILAPALLRRRLPKRRPTGD